MKTLLKMEELAEARFALAVFAFLPYACWVLPATFLLPDLSMAGYLAGPRVPFAITSPTTRRWLWELGWWLGQPGLLVG